MSTVVARAEQLAEEITTALVAAALPFEARGTADIRGAVPPCVLVVPVPTRDYSTGCGFLVEWRLVALAAGSVGDLEAARVLEALVDVTATVVDVERAEAASYRLPTSEATSPAYLITTTESAE